MTYSEAFKNGIKLVNRNLQLVAIQAGLMLIDCIGFFIIVGIPLGIAFVIFGLDLTGLKELGRVFSTLKNPMDLLTRYFGLVVIVLISLLIYITMVTTLWLFVFAGTTGIIGGAVVDPGRKFTLGGFFREARRFFVPLMWFSLLIGLIFIAAALVMGLLSGGAAAVVSAAKSQDSTLALFLGIFSSLLLILIGVVLVLGIFATAVYGVAVIYFRGEGAMRSLVTAAGYLWDRPDAFWLYVLLICGYVLTSFMLMLVVYPFSLIPFFGPIIYFPSRIVSYVIQGYLGLLIMGVVFSYYDSTSCHPDDKSSSPPEDTSPFQVPGQETPPPGTDQIEQV